jgi:hypothetical protein
MNDAVKIGQVIQIPRAESMGVITAEQHKKCGNNGYHRIRQFSFSLDLRGGLISLYLSNECASRCQIK